MLVVDDAKQPLGWYDARAGVAGVGGGGVQATSLNRGGTVATQGGSLRAALDAALSSPSGRGVLVDEGGQLLGTISAGEVLERIEAGPMTVQAAADGPPPWRPSGVDWTFLHDNAHTIAGWFAWHAWLAVVPVVIGLVVALPIGWVMNRYRWTYPPLVSIAGVLYTIPSIALFVVLPGMLHTKMLAPDQRGRRAHDLHRGADGAGDRRRPGVGARPRSAQAATAMGLTGLQRLVRVELPIAVPVIAAGLRVATVANVSLVAVAR